MAPTPVPLKPGWQSSEFWLCLVITGLLGAIASGQFLPQNHAAQVAAALAVALLGGGYALARTQLKGQAGGSSLGGILGQVGGLLGQLGQLAALVAGPAPAAGSEPPAAPAAPAARVLPFPPAPAPPPPPPPPKPIPGPGGTAAGLGLALALGLATAGCGTLGTFAAQVQQDANRALTECGPEAVITACQCAARVLRDDQCQRLRAAGNKSLPPACRDVPATQPGRS